MKAVVFHTHGGPEQLVYEEFPDPKIDDNEALVKVKACSINHLDIWIRQGIPAYKTELPHISGCDVSGVVAEIGKNVEDIKVGDRAIISPGISCFRCDHCIAGNDNLCTSYKIFGAGTQGGYAEYTKALAKDIIPIPDNMTFVQAAAFPLTFMTAYHMLVTLVDLRAGRDVLVIAAGSGVGSAAIRIANFLGARVIATVGSDEKIEKARLIGAEEVINYTREDLPKRIKELTDGCGVDVVFENAGPETWQKSIACLARNGKLVTCGATSGPIVQVDLRFLFMRQLRIFGSVMGTRRELMEVIRLFLTGRLRNTIDSVFELKDARKAQERMLERKNFGKILLEMKD